MPQQQLEQRVLRFIQEHNLISNRPLVVAVSGGPDSVCLLHILSRLCGKLNLKLHVAHLDHQLRGAESEADARYVADLSRRLNIPSTIDRRDVQAHQTRLRLSPEEAARDVRYAFLAQAARAVGADRVAVGHTTDDHIETILMHLIRGSGTRGLRGLQPCSRWQSSEDSVTIIRPLLEVNRQETADYCHHHRLMPRIDPSNQSLSPLRNRIRLQLLPLLEHYNPRAREALLRTSRIATDDLAFIDEEITRLWDKIALKQKEAIVLDKEKFLELPSALKRHMLRTAIENLADLKDIEARHIEEIIDALGKPTGKRLDLPGGLTFSIEYDRYLISTDPKASVPFPVLKGESQLKIPGETTLNGWHVEATVITPESMKDAGDYKAYLDFDRTGDKIAVRSRQPGDRFQPLGISQPKKLNEFMIDAKIPRAWRQRIPIVCSPDQILWVAGWRIDDRVKVTGTTGKVLCLKFELS